VGPRLCSRLLPSPLPGACQMVPAFFDASRPAPTFPPLAGKRLAGASGNSPRREFTCMGRGHTCFSRRQEITSLLSGVQVESLGALHDRSCFTPSSPSLASPVPVSRPGASPCRCALFCYACSVPSEQAPHDGLSASCPCTSRSCTGRLQGKKAGQHATSWSREDLLEEESVTALT
jgi:hypothetical protein